MLDKKHQFKVYRERSIR